MFVGCQPTLSDNAAVFRLSLVDFTRCAVTKVVDQSNVSGRLSLCYRIDLDPIPFPFFLFFPSLFEGFFFTVSPGLGGSETIILTFKKIEMNFVRNFSIGFHFSHFCLLGFSIRQQIESALTFLPFPEEIENIEKIVLLSTFDLKKKSMKRQNHAVLSRPTSLLVLGDCTGELLLIFLSIWASGGEWKRCLIWSPVWRHCGRRVGVTSTTTWSWSGRPAKSRCWSSAAGWARRCAAGATSSPTTSSKKSQWPVCFFVFFSSSFFFLVFVVLLPSTVRGNTFLAWSSTCWHVENLIKTRWSYVKTR